MSSDPPKPPSKRKGRFDDETMVGLKPIASVGDDPPTVQKAAKKKSPFDEPTMKHVANAPRPSRTKYDDETQRTLAPLESNPPSAPVSSIATSTAAETQASLPVSRVSHVDPTMNMEPLPADAPLSAKKTMQIDSLQPPPAMTSPHAQTVERRSRPETIAMEPQPVPAESTKVTREIVERWLLERRSLQGVDLSGADLRELDLRGQNLRGARLIGAQLDGARLDHANCAEIIATNVSAASSSWTGADLTKADLSKASLHSARFDKAKMNGAKLDEVAGERVVLDDAELRDFQCEGATLMGISARRVAARGSVWDKSDVTDGTFEGADLAEASFRGARLHRARLVRADLSNVRFELADLSGVDILGATLLGTNLLNLLGRGRR